MPDDILQFARQVIEAEAAAAGAMAGAIDESFERAVRLILACGGSVLTSGVGKAGHVARKLSATFASTGTPSHFLSAADAVHGDLGSIRKGDIVLILSASGESDEVLRLLSLVKKLDHPVIAMTASASSGLGRVADLVLAMGKIEEPCPLGLAPERIDYRHDGAGGRPGSFGDEAAEFQRRGFRGVPSRRADRPKTHPRQRSHDIPAR